MKEEIFLFYKEFFEPRIRFLLDVARRLLSNLGLIKIKTVFNESLTLNLLIRDRVSEENKNYYKKLNIKFQEINFDELFNLKPGIFYFLLGSHDEVFESLNYLRKIGIVSLWRQIWMKENNNKPFWKRRISVVEAIYSDLMTEQIDDKSIIVNEQQEWIDFENSIFNKYIENKSYYKELINGYLKDGWELHRINPITISILLEAISEHDALKTDALVLITQSVKTAKNYCDASDYKIINAILDRYFRSL